MKCRMMAFHQIGSVKNMYRKIYFTIEMQPDIFLKLFLVPYMYAFTCCNLRVGKYDYFGVNISPSSGEWTVETHKAFATCASQYSWNTVIENHSNAKEIWSGHGIQTWTSVSCFDHSCIELLGNLGSPLTLKRTWIYALIISYRRTAGTLTFVKTMAIFSTVCLVLLYTSIFALVYQMPHIFPALS